MGTVSPWWSVPKPDNNALGVWKRGGVRDAERRKGDALQKEVIRKSNKKI